MAARNGTGAKKTSAKNTSNSAQGGRGNSPPAQRRRIRRYWAILFWLGFIIIIYGLFLFNREAISSSIAIIRNERIARRNIPTTVPSEIVQPPPPVIPIPPPPVTPVQPVPILPPEPPPHVAPLEPPIAEPTPPQGPAELRERTLYFTQVDRAGMIFRTGVNRNLPVSNTPMTDVLNALIDGPSEDERRRGLISLIPPDTKILSATVRGETAYLNFSEDFLYNTYGVDGYIGQLRQVIYTVTEFANISDVQILIEGGRVNFLGKGIWIGSPIRRGMF